MSALSFVRLELGRTHIFQQGNPRYGYEFVVPLTAHGHVDAQAWRHAKERCWVRHFSEEGRDTYGLLRHIGHDWYFDCGYEREAGDAFFQARPARVCTRQLRRRPRKRRSYAAIPGDLGIASHRRPTRLCRLVSRALKCLRQ